MDIYVSPMVEYSITNLSINKKLNLPKVLANKQIHVIY